MVKGITGAALALLWSAGGAGAIVGGAEDAGALSRASLMVLSSNGGVCSGVVVARDVVLTAGHCATGAAEYRVHWRGEDGEPVMIEPAARAVHPGYNAKAIETRQRSIDLALVRLPGPLPARFAVADLTDLSPARDASVQVGGYGVSREGVARTTGTFRSASLTVVQPYGASTVLVWLQGAATGACQGDSGGPITQDGSVLAVTTWAKGNGRAGCGHLTQGVLVGPQRAWIDRTLQGWGRAAQWR